MHVSTTSHAHIERRSPTEIAGHLIFRRLDLSGLPLNARADIASVFDRDVLPDLIATFPEGTDKPIDVKWDLSVGHDGLITDTQYFGDVEVTIHHISADRSASDADILNAVRPHIAQLIAQVIGNGIDDHRAGQRPKRY